MIHKDSQCPCGSGNRFGDCHGMLSNEQSVQSQNEGGVTEETYNMGPSGAPVDPSHQFFRWVGGKPDQGTVRDLALRLANYYFQVKWSRKQWSKNKNRKICQWEAPAAPARASLASDNDADRVVFVRRASNPLNLDDFERALETGKFDYEKLGLPAPSTHWLDASVSFLKIRECAGALPDPALVELLLQRDIEFCSRDSGKRRVAQSPDVGYASTSERAMDNPGPARHQNDIVMHSHAGLHRLLR